MTVKLVLVIRADLGMRRGKIAVQVAHAAVAAALASRGSQNFAAWLEAGQPKVVVQVASAEQLGDIARQAQVSGVPVQLVHDSGRTPAGLAWAAASGVLSSAAAEPVVNRGDRSHARLNVLRRAGQVGRAFPACRDGRRDFDPAGAWAAASGCNPAATGTGHTRQEDQR